VQIWINEMLALPGGSLRIERELIDISSDLPTVQPDSAWSEVDPQGHFHAFAADGTLPTLTNPTFGDESLVTWLECRLCFAVIEPSYVPAEDGVRFGRRSAPGRTRWDVNATLPIEPRVLDGSLRAAQVSVRMRDTATDKARFGVAVVTRLSIDARSADVELEGMGELHERLAA
jgi:hypothetical protein